MKRRKLNVVDETTEQQRSREVVSLPDELSMTIGDFSVGRGIVSDSVPMFAWDASKTCNGRECPAHDYCDFYKNVGEPCEIANRFMAQVYSVVLNAVEAVPAGQREAILMRVGFDLIPLYKNLISLNLAEMGVDKIIEVEGRGMRKANPVYKEIRDTIKLIESTWNTIGIGTIPNKKILSPGGGKMQPKNQSLKRRVKKGS